MNNSNITFNDMTHDQVMSVIKEGLHYLTTIDLVSLHAEISKVQIEHSHKKEYDGDK
jgi:hypothetical protein